MLSLGGVAYLLASPLVGWLCDRFDHRRRDIMALGICVMASTFGPLAHVANLGLFGTLLAVQGAFLALVTTPNIPSLNDIIERKYAGRFYGAVGALQNAAWSLGSFGGPLIAGGMAERSDTLALWTLSALLAASVAVFIFFSNHPRWRRRLFGAKDGQRSRPSKRKARSKMQPSSTSASKANGKVDDTNLLDADRLQHNADNQMTTAES